MPPARYQVFISYKDERWREDLDTHLTPFLRNGSIKSWSDMQIHPGSQWFDEIVSALNEVEVAVLLVTPNFLASDFIREHELGPLLKEAEKGGVTILWVPIRESAYKKTALKNYQSVFSPTKPLAAMPLPGRDKVWVKICEEIQTAVKKPRTGPERGISASTTLMRPTCAGRTFARLCLAGRTCAGRILARRISAGRTSRAPGKLLARSTSLCVPLYVLPVVIGMKNARLTETPTARHTQPN